MAHGDLAALADGALLSLGRTGAASARYQRDLAYAVQALLHEVDRLQRTVDIDHGKITDALLLVPSYESPGVPMTPFRMALDGAL